MGTTRSVWGRWALRGGASLAIVAGILVWQAAPTLSSAADVNPAHADQIAAALGRATVQLVSLGCDLGIRRGSAVALPSGALLTNRHVVDLARETEIVPDVGPVVRSPAQLSATGTDLALLDGSKLGLRALPMAPADASPGAFVTMAGFTAGERGLKVTQAHVIDYVAGGPRGQPVPVMRLDAHIGPGMSGGPVVDVAGRLTGVIFGTESPSDYALALPVSAIRTVEGPAGVSQAEAC